MLSILVEDDIASADGRLAQEVHQLLLLQGEPVKAGDLVTHHLDIGEPIYEERELRRRRGVFAGIESHRDKEDAKQ